MLKKILPALILLPLIIGTIGYIWAGEMYSNAIYAAFALYFTNPISDSYNMFVEIARWTSPLVTATAILYAIQNMWVALRFRIVLWGKKDSVAIYSDTDHKIIFDKHDKNISEIYPGENFKEYARSHIIMFSKDEKNLQFYENHSKALKDKKVYIGIRDIECNFLKASENITVFDINGTIGRMLWKEIAVWNMELSECQLVIWGDSTLTGNIISTGLQLNLFSRGQKLKYHIISDNTLFPERHSGLKLMNGDEIHYHKESDLDIWDYISRADIVIISDVLDAETLQTIVVKAKNAKIYYYSPNEGNMASYFDSKNILPFGRCNSIFTDENIRNRGLLRKAAALNEHYAEKYGTEKEWDALTGFLKGSNISASDFGEVLAVLHSRISEEEQAELEHIRWCRFLYLNYYTFGIPENGKNRDDIKRIHRDLVDYSELDPDEKRKDLEAIRVIKSL